MSKSVIEFKTISQLAGYRFQIPSYQRGYRWKSEEVADLIDDISDFAASRAINTEEFYCLQPVVVVPRGNGDDVFYEVIDGQQRLTTIFLILKHLGKQLFTLEYETRETTKWLTDPASAPAESIDGYYLQNANKKMIAEKGVIGSAKWEEALEKRTQIIWYAPEEASQDRAAAIHLFKRLNVGKIRLTNSELIRALFISKCQGLPASEMNEYKIASEWDYIEQQLHNDDFWCFITLGMPRQYAPPNRISFLINLAHGETAKNVGLYGTFKSCQMRLSNSDAPPVEACWQEIKNIYYRLHQWFEDGALYHRIGFLLHLGKEDVGSLLKRGDGETQSSLTNQLTELIAEDVNAKSEDFLNLEYGNKKVLPILMLHNVATSEQRNERFSFLKFSAVKWDIEHVHAQADEVAQNMRADYMLDWLGYYKKQYSDMKDELDRLSGLVERYHKDSKNDSNSKKLNEIFQEFLGVSSDLESAEHQLSNLVLLDQGTNRSYKNSVFPKKRKVIFERENNHCYILPCTRDVFAKSYSHGDDVNMGIWSKEDQENYKENIKDTMKRFLKIS